MGAKTLYFECGMGAAGDMIMAGLLELLGDRGRGDFLRRLNDAGIPGVEVSAEPSVKRGIAGTRIAVRIDGRVEGDVHCHGGERLRGEAAHSHGGTPHTHTRGHGTGYGGIESLIGGLRVSAAAKENALGVYKMLADAESSVHGTPVDKIHFHEVGDMDAVADIVGVCMLMDELSPGAVLASPVNAGGGSVRCAHGVMPVPSPAAAFLLRGIPIYGGGDGELCTPTGAALLKRFAGEFCEMPAMSVEKIGYGMGTRDFERANCVRVFMGSASGVAGGIRPNERVVELVCALDDMTPEAVAFAHEELLSAGALDVYAVPAVMKKGRAGVELTCICRIEDRGAVVPLLFKHTTTLGIRERVVGRYALERGQSVTQTKYGEVRVKTASGFGVTKSKPEYGDTAALAREHGVSIGEIIHA